MHRLCLALAAACPALALTAPARACDVALVLAVDVSGSVDAWEYQLQAEGLAFALRDGQVADALVRTRAAIAVVQWSGQDQQTLSIPWTRIEEPAQVARLAGRMAAMPRAHAGGNTAVGLALDFAADLFGPPVRDCARWVIDVSGDGDENEGFTIGQARRRTLTRGITVNGLAIEGLGTAQSITNFYRAWVITPGGFVETAQGHADFARAMRRKLLRELEPPLAWRLHEGLWLAALATGRAPR
jgi:Ca-activated chloride channel homolog